LDLPFCVVKTRVSHMVGQPAFGNDSSSRVDILDVKSPMEAWSRLVCV